MPDHFADGISHPWNLECHARTFTFEGNLTRRAQKDNGRQGRKREWDEERKRENERKIFEQFLLQKKTGREREEEERENYVSVDHK
jgi:hypothetical protein